MRKISSFERQATTNPPGDPLSFDDWAEFFRQRWRRRATGDWRVIRPRPAERGVHLLKRDLYRYYRLLAAEKGIKRLRKHIEDRDRSRWSGHSYSGAAWVIRLVEHDRDNPLLDKSQRHRIRIEMEYAALNSVRHDLLAAFLREAGTIADIKRALDNRERPAWAKKYRG